MEFIAPPAARHSCLMRSRSISAQSSYQPGSRSIASTPDGIIPQVCVQDRASDEPDRPSAYDVQVDQNVITHRKAMLVRFQQPDTEAIETPEG